VDRDIDEQLQDMLDKIYDILQLYPAAIYLRCFYRSEPPRILIREDSIQVLVKEKRVLDTEGYPYDLTARGYRELGKGTCRLAYEFLPGKSFEVEVEGTLMEKRLRPGDLLEEVRGLRASLGVYDLVPLLDMQWVRVREENGVVLRIMKLDPDINPPSYAHPGDAGLDIRSAEDVTLEPGGRAMVSTGFAMALPEGYAAFVQPRSGLAARNGISIVNTPGLIDCHYRGEVKVILVNLGGETFQVRRGDRIAQMVVQRVESARVEVVDELDETARGEGGFGSTGL